MPYSKFKNDGRANPDLVIAHILSETEKNIKALTGIEVTLVVKK